MNKKIIKYFQNQKKISKFEFKKINFLFFKKISFFTLNKYYQKKLFKLVFLKKTVKLRSICLFTGRTRGVYKIINLSRTQIRDLMNSGLISNIQKSSW